MSDLSMTAQPFGWDVGEPMKPIRDPIEGEGWEVINGRLWVDGKRAASPPGPTTRRGLQGWVDMVRDARAIGGVDFSGKEDA